MKKIILLFLVGLTAIMPDVGLSQDQYNLPQPPLNDLTINRSLDEMYNRGRYLPEEEIVKYLSRIALQTHKRVVAAMPVIPRNESSHKLDIKYKQFYIPEFKWAFKEDQIMIYKTVPTWIGNSEIGEGYEVANPTSNQIVDFVNELSPAQKQNLFSLNSILTSSLNEKQKRILIDIFSLRSMNVPEYISKNRTKRLQMIMQDSVSITELQFDPKVFIYNESGQSIGHMEFDEIQTGQLSFIPALKDANHTSTLAWYVPPALIEPEISLEPVYKKLTVKLQANKFVYSLDEIVDILTKQDVPVLGVDKTMRQSRVYLSADSWVLQDLINSLCSTLGCEFRKIGAGYYFAPSPAHKLIANNILLLRNAVLDQERNLNNLRSDILNSDFSHRIKPFDADLFLSSVFKLINELPSSQREVIVNKLGVDLKDKSNLKLWFVLSFRLRISYKGQGSTIGGYLTPVPPESSLRPSADNIWESYPADEMLEKYKVKITNSGRE